MDCESWGHWKWPKVVTWLGCILRYVYYEECCLFKIRRWGRRSPREIEKAKSSGEDPRAPGGLVSNHSHPRVNKTKQHTPHTSHTTSSQASLSHLHNPTRFLQLKLHRTLATYFNQRITWEVTANDIRKHTGGQQFLRSTRSKESRHRMCDRTMSPRQIWLEIMEEVPRSNSTPKHKLVATKTRTSISDAAVADRNKHTVFSVLATSQLLVLCRLARTCSILLSTLLPMHIQHSHTMSPMPEPTQEKYEADAKFASYATLPLYTVVLKAVKVHSESKWESPIL